jgi:predicted RNase H-like HicB family nuclease
MEMHFLVVYGYSKRGSSTGTYSGSAPDVWACFSNGKTLVEVRRNMREALKLDFERRSQRGERLPEPHTTKVDFKDIDVQGQCEFDRYVVEWLEIEVPVPSHAEYTLASR